MSKIKTKWLQGVKTEKEKEEIKLFLQNNKLVLDKLKEIVYNIHNSKLKCQEVDYNSASWAYKQADTNGYVRACAHFIELLDL